MGRETPIGCRAGIQLAAVLSAESADQDRVV